MKTGEGLQMKYFVLRPAGEDEYSVASREAMVAYAAAIRPTNAGLADDLMAWVHRIMMEESGPGCGRGA